MIGVRLPRNPSGVSTACAQIGPAAAQPAARRNQALFIWPTRGVRGLSGSLEPPFQAATSAFVPRGLPAWMCPLESGHGRRGTLWVAGSTNLGIVLEPIAESQFDIARQID